MKSLLAGALLCYSTLTAQNVGIGTTTPTGPLSFSSVLGNKIVLWGNGNGQHYGLGIQSGLLQLYGDNIFSNVAFGYGSSAQFTERARIVNNGSEGMFLNGRLHLRNGSSPINNGETGGIWLYSPDNLNLQAFAGTQNFQNIGFYSPSLAWGFVFNTNNGRVGIGNDNPNAPLAFGPTLGKKITLYPGILGDAGFGMSGNRLQIYADNPNADVAIGFDLLNNGFQERFAFKPNGALALQGNTGSAGQVLTSGGGGAVSWTNAGTSLIQSANGTYVNGITTLYPAIQEVPGSSVTVTISRRSRLFYSANFTGIGPNCALCAEGNAGIFLKLNGNNIANNVYYLTVPNGSTTRRNATIANFWTDLDPGVHTIVSQAVTSFGFQPISNLVCLQSSIIAVPL